MSPSRDDGEPSEGPASTVEVVVGRLGRAHGVRGEISVEPRTDEPERRFAPGTVLEVRAPRPQDRGTRDRSGARHAASLTVAATRRHQGRLLVRFDGLDDRDAAEALGGLLLVTAVAADEEPEDEDAYYDHQLVGLRVLTTEGREVGEVRAVNHAGAQDLLVVDTSQDEVLVPFVGALVPEVDLGAGVLRVVDVPGLLRPEEAEG